MITIGGRIEATGGRSSGFDYLRIILALAVACSHVVATTYGTDVTAQVYDGPWSTPLRTILPMFFALSGFLVAGSLERMKTLRAFLGLRVIRIIPALAVEVTLSALILGPLLTTVPLSQYFVGVEFRTYFLNVVGEIHYHLPGVFLNLPYAGIVNSQLWTIPFELDCYAILALMAVFGVRRWRLVALAASLGTSALFVAVHALHHGTDALSYKEDFGPFLVWNFLWGVTVYAYRDVLPWSKWLAMVSACAALSTIQIDGFASYLMPPFIAYLTVYLGLTNWRRFWFLEHADYSYGVYLYHWVVMQTVMSFAPHRWWINLGLSIPLTIAFAALSWHAVEKRAMLLRKPIMAADRGDRNGSLWAVVAVLVAGIAIVILYRNA